MVRAVLRMLNLVVAAFRLDRLWTKWKRYQRKGLNVTLAGISCNWNDPACKVDGDNPGSPFRALNLPEFEDVVRTIQNAARYRISRNTRFNRSTSQSTLATDSHDPSLSTVREHTTNSRSTRSDNATQKTKRSRRYVSFCFWLQESLPNVEGTRVDASPAG